MNTTIMKIKSINRCPNCGSEKLKDIENDNDPGLLSDVEILCEKCKAKFKVEYRSSPTLVKHTDGKRDKKKIPLLDIIHKAQIFILLSLSAFVIAFSYYLVFKTF